MEGIDGGTLWSLALAVAIAGGAGGFVAGLLGVGGGIVLVPILYWALGVIGVEEAVRMHVAVGTSLATIIPTSIRSLSAHAARDAVDFDLLKRWAPGILAGVALGSVLTAAAGGTALTLVFASVAFLIALNLGLGKESWRLGPALPSVPVQTGIAGAIGTLSTMMGIGGGTFGVTTMTLYGTPVHRAVGTSSGLGLLISVPGAIGLAIGGQSAEGLPAASLGFVNLVGFGLIVPVSVLMAPVGAKVAHSISRTALRRVFAAFLALTSLRLFYEVWAG